MGFVLYLYSRAWSLSLESRVNFTFRFGLAFTPIPCARTRMPPAFAWIGLACAQPVHLQSHILFLGQISCAPASAPLLALLRHVLSLHLLLLGEFCPQKNPEAEEKIQEKRTNPRADVSCVHRSSLSARRGGEAGGQQIWVQALSLNKSRENQSTSWGSGLDDHSQRFTVKCLPFTHSHTHIHTVHLYVQHC